VWEALKKKINSAFPGYAITVSELESLQQEEVAMIQQMGIPFAEAQTSTVWWKIKSGAVGLAGQAHMIDMSLSRLRGEGVLAVPQKASEYDILQADPFVRQILGTAQVGGIIGGRSSMGALLRKLIQALGAVPGTAVGRVLHDSTRGITQFTAANYSRLPAPVQTLLQSAGVTSAFIEGLDIDWSAFVDWFDPFDDDGEGPPDEAAVQALIDSWGTGGAGMAMVPALGFGLGIVKTWTAGVFKNGSPITFFRTADGVVWVQRENGTWKSFRYKRGVMIYSDGATSLRSFLKADRALDHQARKLRRALDRRAPRRAPRALKAPVIIETGPGSVHTR
tara:strand:- start:1363 stop:2367 length:1005 start_codon:yes stop_codon:yes gene_type:complete